MRVVFIGSSRFGLRCLKLINHLKSVEVVGTITNERTFAISYAPHGVTNVLYDDLGSYAKSRNIPCYVMRRKMTEPGLVTRIQSWKPDIFIVVGWYHMVPRSLRQMAPAIGMHASLLPDYSGGAPLVWAIINGETKTGISLFQFGDGVDDGPLIGQASTRISANDTIATVYKRIETLGIRLLKKYVPAIAGSTAVLLPQDSRKRRVFPQRKPEDGLIDWSQPARKIHDFIRAQTHPYPGAFTTFKGKKIHIWESRLALSGAGPGDLPGSFCKAARNQVRVNCAMNTALNLMLVGVDKRDMRAGEWFLRNAAHGENIFV